MARQWIIGLIRVTVFQKMEFWSVNWIIIGFVARLCVFMSFSCRPHQTHLSESSILEPDQLWRSGLLVMKHCLVFEKDWTHLARTKLFCREWVGAQMYTHSGALGPCKLFPELTGISWASHVLSKCPCEQFTIQLVCILINNQCSLAVVQ